MERVLVSLILLHSCCLLGIQGKERIVGGSQADYGHYQFKVSIQSISNVNHACSGVVLEPQWILTSALCIAVAPPNDLAIAVGSHHIWEPAALHYALSAYYPDLTDILANDIALIRLTEPIQLGYDVTAAILPTEDVTPNMIGTVAGWGSTQAGVPGNTLLYHLKQLVWGEFACRLALGMDIPETQFCAGNSFMTGPCEGDQGAPLLSDEGVVLGLVSHRVGCGDGMPALYTRVFPYIDWITSSLQTTTMEGAKSS